MRLKALGAVLLLSALYLIIADRAVPPIAAGPNCDADGSIDSEEQVLLGLINDYRLLNGRQPLKFSDTLNRAASWKSQHMATENYLAHDDTPIGRTWVQRIRDCDYTFNTWLAENIAVGNQGASFALDQWRGSPPHNANLLGENFTAIGIGRAFNAGSSYGWYWTLEFGGFSDGYTAPVAMPTASQPNCADLTGDGIVNTADILAAISVYFSTDPNADLDDDGHVALSDLLIILSQYGAHC